MAGDAPRERIPGAPLLSGSWLWRVWPLGVCLGACLLASGALAQADAGPPSQDQPTPGAAPAGDEIIVIEEEAPAAAGGDEIIIIEDEGAEPREPTPRVTGALGRLWETWHVGGDSDLLGALQAVDPADASWRLLGSFWVESSLLPVPNLSLHGNGFARLAVDATPNGRVVPLADLYEVYGKVNVDRATVTAGRIVVPWGRTQGAALGDRVSPGDLRRGPPFPDPVRQKQPAWGATVRGSLGPVGLEGVLLAQYEPTEGSLAAANQGGVRIARYQTALVRSPWRAGGLLAEDDTAALGTPYELARSATLAARASRRLGDVDLGASMVWGFDETPTLHLRPDVARALTAELQGLHPGSTIELPSSCSRPDLACVGGTGTVEHGRQTSFSVDASWGLGIVILRAEALAIPDLGGLGGKRALLVDDEGLKSARVSQFAAALAAEGGIGDWLDGSVEIFDVAWAGVPADAQLWGVELLGDPPPDKRAVHRLASALSLGGSLLGERVSWKLRGEAGVLQPDVLMSAELRYRLPAFGLYVGGRGDLYAGMTGSPGWMRQDASMIGVFVGEGG